VPEPAPAVRVGIAVIVREGKVLIDRRGSGPMAGWWEFPGGKVRPGETPAECVARECREEIGLQVEPLELLRTAVHDYPHGRVELHFYLCRPGDGEPRPIEVAELAWVTPAGSRAYRLLPPNAPVIAELARRYPESEERGCAQGFWG
jgi:mutator protein MutT